MIYVKKMATECVVCVIPFLFHLINISVLKCHWRNKRVLGKGWVTKRFGMVLNSIGIILMALFWMILVGK